jgi:hypothetical protein
MHTRRGGLCILFCLALAGFAGGQAGASHPLAKPSDWVPARWPWADVSSLDLIGSGPVNCLLVRSISPEFAAAAAARGVATLAVVVPSDDAPAAARRALDAKATGIALDGDFPADAIAGVKRAAGSAPVVELGPRSHMLANLGAAIVATDQGLWPGMAETERAHAGPSGSAWIDTNTGFLRGLQAASAAASSSQPAALWIANQPPKKTVVTAARYLQAIADAGMSGARWAIALDDDFAARLGKRDSKTMADWSRMMAMAAYFEQHPEWRSMQEYGKLALVQDPAKGGLLSGGILDMIAVKHTPVRPIPVADLKPGALKDATLAVNVDAGALTPEEQAVLRDFTRAGGTLLTGPPGWSDRAPNGDKITLDQSELERLNDIWREVNSMVGRRNLGVRLFNAATMLSNFLVSADGRTAVLHLVNYSDYPVENVSVQFLGNYRHATLLKPEGLEKPLELYQTEDGWGADIDRVATAVSIELEQ